MTDLPAVQQPGLTDEQRAIILRHVRSGIDLEAAAVEVGVDAATAFRDPELVRLVPEAYVVGTARLRKIALETAITKGDATALMRFIDKREQATQAALASLQEQGGSPLEDFLISHGLTPPEGRSAIDWFIDLFVTARNLLREAGDSEDYQSVAQRRRATAILEAAGYDVVLRSDREEDARRVLRLAGYTVTSFERRESVHLTPAPAVTEILQKADTKSRVLCRAQKRDPDSLYSAIMDGRAALI